MASLPPLGAKKVSQKKEQEKKQGQAKIVSLKRRSRPTVSFFEDKRLEAKTKQVDELYPFADEETGKQMFRRTTKILSHGKYKLAADGEKT